MNIYDVAIKEPTIHQQARTDLLNSYGKYFNKQMYAELWNYTLKCEAKEQRAKKVEELLEWKNKLIKALGTENNSITFAFYTVALHKEIRYKEKELEEMK